MHRASRIVLQASNKIGNSERFASWLLNKPQTSAIAVNVNRLKSSAAAEPFLNGSSSAYVETMYNAWLTDPNSVHAGFGIISISIFLEAGGRTMRRYAQISIWAYLLIVLPPLFNLMLWQYFFFCY